MKKISTTIMLTLLVTLSSFATINLDNKTEVVNPKTHNSKTDKVFLSKKDKTVAVCKIECSSTSNGITVTASAGGWLTGCTRAGNNCLKKLADLAQQL